MEFGVTLPVKADSWRYAQRAEEMGFGYAWFYDTPMISTEVFVAMGAAAAMTKRIKLCTGVLTPSNRLAPVAASGFASLNAMAPGRIVCGIGSGFTGRRTLGRGPMKLADLEAYIRVMEGLLRGETVPWSEEGEAHKVKLLTPDPERNVVNVRDPVPIHISAFGPKGRELTAKLGAGWIGSRGTPDREAAMMADMKAAWRRHGREEKTLYSTLNSGGGCVLKPGEPYDSPRAVAIAGPTAALTFHSLAEQETFGESWHAAFPFKQELAAYIATYKSYPADERHIHNHRGTMTFLRPDETYMTGEIIKATTMTGTVDVLAERVRGSKAAGYSQFTVGLIPGYEEDILTSWSDVLARV
jgi:5,10-methylenetetrahydromethanopterin reductase